MPKILFPHSIAPAMTIDTTVAFRGVFDGHPVTCEISMEALMDHFGATSIHGADLIAAFHANRDAIEEVAQIKLPARLAAGRGLLVTGDF